MSRVVANLCWMVPGEVGGSEEYTTRLLRAVSIRSTPGIDVELAGMSDLASSHPDLTGSYPISMAPISGARRPLRLVVENSWLARRSRDADLVHHFGGHVPAVRAAPAAVTIHDTQPIDMPANFSRTKRAYMHTMLPRTVAAADLICTPSEWVAARVVDRLGADASKLRVVPSTWDDRGADAVAPSRLTSDLLSRLEGFEVVLYPATTHPHKNHMILLRAVSRLAMSHRSMRLVLTGNRGRAHDEVSSAISSSGLRDTVVAVGRVPASTLNALLTRADVLAFPSRYEGFGLPVLEAMRCGTPVVAANAGALPEVLGGAAVMVDPDDVDGWADALGSVLAGGPEVRRLVEAGCARCEVYRPQESARRLLEAWSGTIS